MFYCQVNVMLISRFRVWTIKMKTDKWISNEEVRGANTGKRNYRHSAVLYLQRLTS